jgi:ABC-type branched-subunit amino acid transport system substrate-binding protein
MRLTSRFGVVLSVGALAVSAAACGASDESGDSASGGGNNSLPKEGVKANQIDYGMVFDQTGPSNVSQVPWSHGFMTQIKKANDAGGINGRKINLLTVDEKSEVPLGVAAYKKLATQTPVVGISGYGSSSVQEAVLPMFEKDNMPLVGPQSITKAALVPQKPSVFAVLPPYADQVDVLMGYANKKLNLTAPKVAIFRLTAASGIEVGDLVKERAEKSGGSVVSDQEGDPTATSADAQVQKIVAAKPDYIVLHSTPPQGASVMKSLQKLGAKIPVFSTFAAGGPTAYEAVPKDVGSQLEYTAAVTPADIDVPGNATLLQDAKKYGYEKEATNTAFTFGYLSGMVVVEGLKKAGKELSRANFIKGLEQISNIDTGGVSDAITYGKDDHIGLSSTRPYKYNYDTKKFESIGEYADYASYITNQYGG